MYKLEITTADNIEKLSFSNYVNTWEELKEKIDFFKKLQFDNIYLRAYEEKENDLVYLGEFSKINPKKRETIKNKKIKLSTKILIIELLLFPFMLLKEIIKEQ